MSRDRQDVQDVAARRGAEPRGERPPGLAEEPARNEWLGILVRGLVAAIVLAGLYVAAAHYLGSRVPNGTSVEGVAIGGLTPQTARERLESQLDLLATDPVVVTAEGEDLSLDPATAGLTLDLDRTLDDITGVSYDPQVLWDRLTDSGAELPLVVSVDEAALQSALAAKAQEFDTEPEEGQVFLALGEVNVVEPVAGRALDVAAASAALAAGWPDVTRVEGTVRPVPTLLTPEEIQRFVAEEAEPALASPIVVQVGEETARLTTNQLSRLLTVEESPEHTLSLVLDEATLVELVRGVAGEVERAPVDARVELVDDRPAIIPAEVGQEIDTDDLVTKVRGVLLAPGERQVEVALTELEPEVGEEETRAWDVDQVMAEFTSPFPTGPENEARTQNIRVGLGHVNGTVVMPGEQFSLAERLAPITAERGYVEAGVIVDGRLVNGIGGGLSQVSTTVLNTAWFAGVQLDEFTPHSYYISRYPVGREATIAIGLIDNVWTNDTDSPIVVQAGIEGDEIQMRFWGDRQYTVETITGERTNVVEPERSTDDSEDCLPQAPVDGFDITVTRVLRQGDTEVAREEYRTSYDPSPEVVCTDS